MDGCVRACVLCVRGVCGACMRACHRVFIVCSVNCSIVCFNRCVAVELLFWVLSFLCGARSYFRSRQHRIEGSMECASNVPSSAPSNIQPHAPPSRRGTRFRFQNRHATEQFEFWGRRSIGRFDGSFESTPGGTLDGDTGVEGFDGASLPTLGPARRHRRWP